MSHIPIKVRGAERPCKYREYLYLESSPVVLGVGPVHLGHARAQPLHLLGHLRHGARRGAPRQAEGGHPEAHFHHDGGHCELEAGTDVWSVCWQVFPIQVISRFLFSILFFLQFVVFVFVVASARLEVARFSGLNLRCGEQALNLTSEPLFISDIFDIL